MLLIGLSCAWIAGIYVGSYFHLSPWWIISALLPLTVYFIFKKRRKYLLLLMLVLLGFTAGTSYYPHSLDTNTLAHYIDRGNVDIQGRIAAQPEIHSSTVHIEVDVSTINGDSSSGRILLFVPLYPQYHYADSLKINGKLQAALIYPGFDYQAYLSKQGISATMLSPSVEVTSKGEGSVVLTWIYNFRDKLSLSLSSVLPEPQASLAQGIILGVRSSIPDDIKNQLSISGTTHILAISGINLSILAGILISLGIRLFGRRRYYYVWLALSIIWFYTVLTGWQASVIRAAIMASVFLFAEYLGRQKYALPALALSAAIMVGLDPQLLWSISFQLSFLAMVGLIFIAPLFLSLWQRLIIERYNENNLAIKLVTPVADSFAVTLGATIAVWPIIAYNFNIVSFVGPLATFLITPVLTPIILLGIATALIGLVFHPLAQVLGWILWLFLTYMLVLVKGMAGLPAAALQTSAIPLVIVQIYYSFLAATIFIKANWRKLRPDFSVLNRHFLSLSEWLAQHTPRAPRKYIIIPLLLAALLMALAAISLPDQYLHISFLDVGEGDATLIQSSGQNILVDGGPTPQAICLGLSQKLPYWEHTIDLVILSHPHLDHLSGLIEILKRYDVKNVLSADMTADTAAYKEWMKLIKAKNIPVTYAVKGQQIKLSNGTILEVLNSPQGSKVEDDTDLENFGIVLKVTSGMRSFLFTADIENQGEARLLKENENLTCSVLKVAHHGSNDSSSLDFLRVANPQVAVISCGTANLYGHPGQATLERLNQQMIYRTDLSGTVEFTTDGTALWVKTDR